MRVYRNESFKLEKPCVIALGTFDGVHIGHQKLMQKAVEFARANDWLSMVYTFDRNPVEVLDPENAPDAIQSTEEKIEKIGETGIDICCVRHFDYTFAETEAADFVNRILSTWDVRAIVTGFNYTFGRNGKGNPALLRECAEKRGCRVYTVDRVTYEGETVSSTLIRGLLRSGDKEKAEKML